MDPQIIVLLVVTSAVVFLKISHTCSRGARGWRVAARSMAARRGISAEIAGQGANARDNVTNACRHFKSSVQSERLRRTPVSVLEKARSGARLQSLRAAGITSLDQIRDWGAARFDALPGVGPKSAHIITSLVQGTVAEILKQTVDPPRFPFASESEQLVMNAIYRQRWFEKNLELSHIEYSSQIRAIDENLQSLRNRVSFIGWLGTVFLPERMGSLMRDVLSVKKAACQNPELDKLGESLHGLSVELNRLNIWRIERDVIIKAYSDDYKAFDAQLERYFGRTTPARVQNRQAPSEPVEVAMPPDNVSEKSVPIPKPPADSHAGFTQLEALKTKIETSGQPQLIEISAFFKMFAGTIPESSSLSQATECARTLGLYGMGMEPDPRVTKRMPGESVALFLGSGLESQIFFSKNFAFAEVLLRLTAMVITPKEISEEFAEAILSKIQEGMPLLSSERARLKARLKVYQIDFPVQVSLGWMKLDSIRKNVREKTLDSLVHLLALKGELNAEEVRRLEKITRAMDLDQSAIYSRLHQAQTGSSSAVSAPIATRRSKAAESESISFTIDYARVQKLQEESEKIAEVLADVFSDDFAGSPIVETSAAAVESEAFEPSILLSLDQPHSSLLQYLLEKPQWPRNEIEAACAERGLMVDGALERINEAAFNVYDAPILEGDDPVEVRSDLIKECTAA